MVECLLVALYIVEIRYAKLVSNLTNTFPIMLSFPGNVAMFPELQGGVTLTGVD